MKQQYEIRLPILREAAREHGYALGLHGSGERDLDVIAVPWVEEASSPEVLVEALRESVDGFIIDDAEAELGNMTRRNPEYKPHGRLAWAIHLHDPGGRLYIDLSVIPPQNRDEVQYVHQLEAVVAYCRWYLAAKKSWDNRLRELVSLKSELAALEKIEEPRKQDEQRGKK